MLGDWGSLLEVSGREVVCWWVFDLAVVGSFVHVQQ